MGWPTLPSDRENVSIVITGDQKKWLLARAAKIQAEEGRRVSVSEVVRDLINSLMVQEDEGEEVTT